MGCLASKPKPQPQRSAAMTTQTPPVITQQEIVKSSNDQLQFQDLKTFFNLRFLAEDLTEYYYYDKSETKISGQFSYFPPYGCNKIGIDIDQSNRTLWLTDPELWIGCMIPIRGENLDTVFSGKPKFNSNQKFYNQVCLETGQPVISGVIAYFNIQRLLENDEPYTILNQQFYIFIMCQIPTKAIRVLTTNRLNSLDRQHSFWVLQEQSIYPICVIYLSKQKQMKLVIEQIEIKTKI